MIDRPGEIIFDENGNFIGSIDDWPITTCPDRVAIGMLKKYCAWPVNSKYLEYFDTKEEAIEYFKQESRKVAV